MLVKIVVLTVLSASALQAQNETLDGFVRHALDSNLALKQADFSYQKSMAALNEARGMFLPSVSLEARYSRAQGGRIIDLPIGDLMNPVYNTLNLLTHIPLFPTDVPNQQFQFFREREHDTKVRIVQPVFQPQIYFNYKIKKYASEIENASRNAYARQLVADVKTAYYNYLAALQVVRLSESTLQVLQENLRVSENLVKNDKATVDVVYRAHAELSRIEQKKAEAEKLRRLAKAYFNFLLNRPLDKEIEIELTPFPADTTLPDYESVEANALQRREELQQLNAAMDAQQNGVKLSRANFLPSLSLVFDYGYQGEQYTFTDDYDYWMASAVLQWNFFHGGQDRARVQQAKLDYLRLETQKEELQKKIQLDVRRAFENVRVVKDSIEAAMREKKAAHQNFEIISKKWRLGMAPQIEYLDARNPDTQAELNSIIVHYDYFIKQAELQKAAAMYPWPKKMNAGE